MLSVCSPVEMPADQIRAYLRGISRGIYYRFVESIYRRQQTTLSRVGIQRAYIKHHRSQRTRIGTRCRLP